MESKYTTPLKAIRLKCLDCCCGSAYEVKLCTAERCPLYPFRDGHNPNIGKRELTPEQREAAAARMAAVRLLKKQEKNHNVPSEGIYIPQIKNGETTQENKEKSNV